MNSSVKEQFGFHLNTSSDEDDDVTLTSTPTATTSSSVTSSVTMTTTTTSGIEFFPVVKQPVHMIVIYSIAYAVVLVLGVVGNSLVVAVVCRNPRMQNVTNYFIVNLAIADVLVSVFCLPITLMSNILSGKYTEYPTAMSRTYF